MDTTNSSARLIDLSAYRARRDQWSRANRCERLPRRLGYVPLHAHAAYRGLPQGAIMAVLLREGVYVNHAHLSRERPCLLVGGHPSVDLFIPEYSLASQRTIALVLREVQGWPVVMSVALQDRADWPHTWIKPAPCTVELPEGYSIALIPTQEGHHSNEELLAAWERRLHVLGGGLYGTRQVAVPTHQGFMPLVEHLQPFVHEAGDEDEVAAELRAVSLVGRAERWTLLNAQLAGGVLLGTGEGCDINLAHLSMRSYISSLHAALIELERGQFALVDVGSTNGTKIGGIAVTMAVLPKRATIELAGVHLAWTAGAPLPS